jgi:hypothetical protein
MGHHRFVYWAGRAFAGKRGILFGRNGTYGPGEAQARSAQASKDVPYINDWPKINKS